MSTAYIIETRNRTDPTAPWVRYRHSFKTREGADTLAYALEVARAGDLTARVLEVEDLDSDTRYDLEMRAKHPAAAWTEISSFTSATDAFKAKDRHAKRDPRLDFRVVRSVTTREVIES